MPESGRVGRDGRRPLAVGVVLVLVGALVACGPADGGADGAAPTAPETTGAAQTGTPTAPPADAATTPGTAPTGGSGAAAGASPLPDSFRLGAESVATVPGVPVYVTSPPGDPRLFVLEQGGRISIVVDGEVEVFLDLTDRVLAGGERGLLGLAFPPDFATGGRLFVHYTGRPDGDTVIESYAVSPDDPDRGDPGSARPVLEVDQPDSLHNGGQLLFGPDGRLWVGLGDGGPAEDPAGTGQDPTDLLGSILRLEVGGERPHRIPEDNPFAAGDRGHPAVWAFGLRNPWRFSIDRATDRLYIGDVGQYRFEEIDVVPVDARAPNLGWSVREGAHCFPDLDAGCPSESFVAPVVEYAHDDSHCAVIGGYVYRGEDIPALTGHYVYGDLCSGALRSLWYRDGEVVEEYTWPLESEIGQPTSLGTDRDGEIYLTTQDGAILRLTGRS